MKIKSHLCLRINLAKKTDIELYEGIWKEKILLPQNVLDAMEVRNNVNTNRMCRFEKKKIKVKLEEIIENGEIKNAIYIYTERKLNHERWLTEGIGVILLLRKVVHNDIFFDIKRAILVPIIELISYRIDSILEKHNINTSFPHICWIDLLHKQQGCSDTCDTKM